MVRWTENPAGLDLQFQVPRKIAPGGGGVCTCVLMNSEFLFEGRAGCALKLKQEFWQ